MDTIFTVKAGHLARLSSTKAVDFFRELLWAEATRIGIGKHLINVSTAITVKDGGIDAEIRDVPANAGQGIIKQDYTSYQIKTGKYSLRDVDNVRKILFTPRSNATVLEPRVKGCLDRNGTFIVVLFGWDAPENESDEFMGILRNALKDFDPQYANAKIEVWQPNQILSFLEPFPSLALKVNGNADKLFQTHQSWSEQSEMRRSFKVGDAQSRFLSDLQMWNSEPGILLASFLKLFLDKRSEFASQEKCCSVMENEQMYAKHFPQTIFQAFGLGQQVSIMNR